MQAAGLRRATGFRCSAAPVGHVQRPRSVVSHATSRHSAEQAPVQPLLAIATAALSASLIAGPAHAEKVGEFAGSGFLFKDTVEVMALDDPDVPGVTLYLSEFQRNIADKLKKDFFSDPSQASLTCALTGPVNIADAKRLGDSSGVEVFSEKKSLNLFQDKTIRIRRVYDAKRDTLLYISFSTRLSTASDDGGVSGGRYRTSLCAIKIPPALPAPSVQLVDDLASPAP